VKAGRREPVESAVIEIDRGDTLDFDAVFAVDAVPGLHGVECAGAAGCTLDVEEGDESAVGRPLKRADCAVELADLFEGVGGGGEDEDVVLRDGLPAAVGAGAAGEEGELFAVG
jgi:hypothetical protein